MDSLRILKGCIYIYIFIFLNSMHVYKQFLCLPLINVMLFVDDVGNILFCNFDN